MDALFTYLAELVGFGLIVYVLVRKVVPPVRAMAAARQAQIRKQIEAAAAASERLAVAEKAYRDAIAEARTEAAKIRDGARADAERILVETREQAQREVVRIRQRAEEELITQREQVARDLRARIGQLSVALAGRLVTEHLTSADRREATVDRLLDELAGIAEQTSAGAVKDAVAKGSRVGNSLVGKGNT